MDETFIQFGCWNNLNDDNVHNLEKTMRFLKEYISRQNPKPKFLAVSGDNYYPKKEKSKEGTTLGENVFPQKLAEGFDLLPRDLPIHMILGNHDLETNNIKKNALKIVEDPVRDENKECEILQMEKKKANIKENIEFSFFKHIMLSRGTLVLMIDTSIYEKDSKSYLPCYTEFFKDNTAVDTTTIESLRETQKRLIQEAITEALKQHKIKNIILVGHHPILYLKYKEEKDKPKKDKSEKEKTKTDKSEKDKSENPAKEKQKGVIIRSDINIKPLLEEIFTILPDVKYHYLCSDLHLYQKGKITIDFGGKQMEIQQYIVGTGGTKLDNKIPDFEIDEYKKSKKNTEEDNIKYEFEEEIQEHGFLECENRISGPVFDFIDTGSQILENDIRFKPLYLRRLNKIDGGKRTKKQKNKKNKTKSNKKRTRKV